MHILFVTFFNLFVFYLQVDVAGPLLLNISLLLILTTDYSDWLVQVTELTDIDNDVIFWVLTIVWLNNIFWIQDGRRPSFWKILEMR